VEEEGVEEENKERKQEKAESSPRSPMAQLIKDIRKGPPTSGKDKASIKSKSPPVALIRPPPIQLETFSPAATSSMSTSSHADALESLTARLSKLRGIVSGADLPPDAPHSPAMEEARSLQQAAEWELEVLEARLSELAAQAGATRRSMSPYPNAMSPPENYPVPPSHLRVAFEQQPQMVPPEPGHFPLHPGIVSPQEQMSIEMLEAAEAALFGRRWSADRGWYGSP